MLISLIKICKRNELNMEAIYIYIYIDVKKSVQKKRSEVALKKRSKTDVKKAKVQRKLTDQNDRSIVVWLKKLLVVLEGKVKHVKDT